MTPRYCQHNLNEALQEASRVRSSHQTRSTPGVMAAVGPACRQWTAVILITVIAAGCVPGSSDQSVPNDASARPQSLADSIIAEAIAYQGNDLLNDVEITFRFRQYDYRVRRNNGIFEYERQFSDSLGHIRDVVNNDEIYREIDGNRVVLDSVKHRSVYVDVNSVVYFALLPQPLGDGAVRTRYLGTASVASTEYHKVEVTFNPEGGGLDHDDRFVYWIRPEPAVIDYMSYYYHTDGGGSRFREAYNQRRVGGILFSDYHNYSAPVDSTFADVHIYDGYFEDGLLTRVSDIALEDLQVRFPQ